MVNRRAIQTWQAEPRTTPGGRRRYSALAISTALTMGMVFGLALRQTEGLIGSVIGLLGLTSPCRTTPPEPPDHSPTAGNRSAQFASGQHWLEARRSWRPAGRKHGTSRRRSWRKLHISVDAETGEITAVAVTRKDIDDAAMVDALLDQTADPVASFTADGAYDQDQVSQTIGECHPDAAVIMPPRWRVPRPKPPPHSATATGE